MSMKKPKIRFKGYTEDWEQRKVLDLLIQPITDGPHETPELVEDGVPFISVDAIVDNKIDFNRKRGNISEEYDEICCKKYKPQLHDVYLVKSGSTVGKVAIVETTDRFNIWSPLAAMRCGDITNPYFLYNLLQTRDLQSQVADKASNGTQPNLSMRELEKFPVVVPKNTNEQKKIGEYFSELDKLITLHQRKCNQAEKLKKYMLQKMFPQNGEKNPEIRYDGFTDDWEQRKLEDWGTFYYGHSCPKWSVTADATTPCIRYGELYTKFGTKIDRVFSYTNMPTDKLRFSKGTEVLIPRVGEDPMDYNHCTWLSMPGVAIGEMISVFNTEQNPLFAATMFNATLQKEFAMRVEGGSVTNLYFEKLKNIETSFPKIEEQEKIARFFEEIDNLITLHQRKCDELKKIKKFMLQNMFV